MSVNDLTPPTVKEEVGFRAKPVVIVAREEWEPEPPKATIPMVHPVKKVVFTFDTDIPVCTTRDDCLMAMQVLQGRHMLLEGCDDIKYNFLVGGDGVVYEGRGFYSQPCKSLEYPEHHGDRLDIAYIGEYKGYSDLTARLAIAGYDTAQKGINEGYVAEFYEYYEVKPPIRPKRPPLEEFIEKEMAKTSTDSQPIQWPPQDCAQ